MRFLKVMIQVELGFSGLGLDSIPVLCTGRCLVRDDGMGYREWTV